MNRAFLFNLLGFNLVWALLIIVREPWTQGVALAFIAAHFLFFARSDEKRRVALVMLVGVVLDGILTLQGWFIFTPAVPWIPAWLMLLWGCFACTLEHSIRWSLRKWPLAVVVGALAGPFSYWAGQRFGAVEFGQPLLATLTVLAVIWGTLFAALAHLYQRLGVLADR